MLTRDVDLQFLVEQRARPLDRVAMTILLLVSDTDQRLLAADVLLVYRDF